MSIGTNLNIDIMCYLIYAPFLCSCSPKYISGAPARFFLGAVALRVRVFPAGAWQNPGSVMRVALRVRVFPEMDCVSYAFAYSGTAVSRAIPRGGGPKKPTNRPATMPANPPYIPTRDADLEPWAVNFDAVIDADEAAYGLAPADAAIIHAPVAAFSAALATATNPATRTSATIAAKDAAKAAMLDTVRPYAVGISANPAVSDGDKVTVGVTVRVTTRTPIPAPGVAPILALDSLQIGAARMRYSNPALPSGKAKGYGNTQVEISITTGTAVSVDPDSSARREFATKAPFSLSFAPGDRGKTATLWARLRTTSGPSGISQSGPWSASVSFVLP